MDKKYCLFDEDKICDNCGECDRCDLDPNKICDNCGKCLDEYNTDEKGFIKVGIDKILTGEEATLDDFYMMGGLIDDEEDECDDEHCDCGHTHHNHKHHHHDCDCGCEDE